MSSENKIFESRLGDVAVTDSHVERERKGGDDWELLEKNFPERMIADEIQYSKIKHLTYKEGSTFPYIEFETEDEKKKMFFSIGDPYKIIFKEIKEKLAVHRQAFQ